MILITDSKDERLDFDTLCPQCGPKPLLDEDGVCASCGGDAQGHGIDLVMQSLRAALAERDALHEAYTIQLKAKEAAEAREKIRIEIAVVAIEQRQIAEAAKEAALKKLTSWDNINKEGPDEPTVFITKERYDRLTAAEARVEKAAKSEGGEETLSIDEQVPIWDAVNEYANSCGADQNIISDRRMNAVVSVNRSIEKLIYDRLNMMIEGAYASAIKRDQLKEERDAALSRAEKAEALLYKAREVLLRYGKAVTRLTK